MKINKKLVAIILSLSLAVMPFSGISVNATQKETTPFVQETTVEAYAASEDSWYTDATSDLTVAEMQIIDMDGLQVSETVPSVLKKKSDISQEKYTKYMIYAPEGYEQDVIIPVKLKSKGILNYALAAAYDSDLYYSLYSDLACTKFISSYDNMAFIEKAGTYYIKIGKYDLANEGDSRISLVMGFINGANAVLKNNTNLISAAFGTDKSVYFKFTVNKTSKLTFKIGSEYGKYITLCNSKKKAITGEEYISGSESKVVFAVSKGTYYIRLKASKGLVSITPTFTAVSNASGPSKAKAGTMKMNGKTQNVVVLPGDSTKKYYYLKFYNPKNQKVYLNTNSSYTSGKMQIEFFNTKNSSFGSRTIWNGINEKNTFNPYVYTYTGNNGYKLPKGTYYVRFTKLDKKTAGIIQVNVKNKKK